MRRKLTPAIEKILRLDIDGPDAEMAEWAKSLLEDYRAGKVIEAPRCWHQCQSWLDAWLYIYRRVHLAHENHLSHKGEVVTFAVLVGPDFDDRAVAWLERFHERLGACTGLSRLRLVGTRASRSGIARLRALFSSAVVESYTFADAERDASILYPPGRFE